MHKLFTKIVTLGIGALFFSEGASANISDLNYAPKAQELVAKSKIELNRSQTYLMLSSDEYLLETNQHIFSQSLRYGLNDWISTSITLPFLFNGNSKIETVNNNQQLEYNSDLRRSIFGVTAQLGPDEGAKSYFEAKFQESEADISGFYQFSYSIRQKLDLNFYMLNFNFTEFKEDYVNEKVQRYSVNFLMQLALENGFFLRPGLGVSEETALEFKSSNEVLEGDFIFTPSLGLGQELSTHHLYWLLEYDYSYSKVTYFNTSVQNQDGDLINHSLSFELGYKF